MHYDDPGDMSIDDRLKELATLVAVGFLRLKHRTDCLPAATYESAESPKTPSDSAWRSSEPPALCVPHVDVMCRSW